MVSMYPIPFFHAHGRHHQAIIALFPIKPIVGLKVLYHTALSSICEQLIRAGICIETNLPFLS